LLGIHDFKKNQNIILEYDLYYFLYKFCKYLITNLQYKFWQAKLLQKGKEENRTDLIQLAQHLPRLEELFAQTRWFIVNGHPMMDYPLVEEEVYALAQRAHAHQPKLHFVGGLGMVNKEHVNVKAEELDTVNT
jgi:uncharacterized protein YgfB (UPF0149 family)